jgi:hypothetical protein
MYDIRGHLNVQFVTETMRTSTKLVAIEEEPGKPS